MKAAPNRMKMVRIENVEIRAFARIDGPGSAVKWMG